MHTMIFPSFWTSATGYIEETIEHRPRGFVSESHQLKCDLQVKFIKEMYLKLPFKYDLVHTTVYYSWGKASPREHKKRDKWCFPRTERQAKWAYRIFYIDAYVWLNVLQMVFRTLTCRQDLVDKSEINATFHSLHILQSVICGF